MGELLDQWDDLLGHDAGITPQRIVQKRNVLIIMGGYARRVA
jgi:hypothetical protein